MLYRITYTLKPIEVTDIAFTTYNVSKHHIFIVIVEKVSITYEYT